MEADYIWSECFLKVPKADLLEVCSQILMMP